MADLISMLAAAAGLAQEEGGETDPYFNQTVVLLHGDGSDGAQNNTFLDSSTNNLTVNRSSNTTQGSFSPFSVSDGRWSNYFQPSNYIATTATQVIPATADFTVDGWIYITSTADLSIIARQGTTGTTGRFQIYFNNTNSKIELSLTSTVYSSTGTISINEWVYVAVTRTGSDLKIYINGSLDSSHTVSGAIENTTFMVGQNWGGEDFYGYASNIRVSDSIRTISGNPTAPFTDDANTILLTCQSNRFVDNATPANTISVTGTPKVTPFSPFAPTAAYDPAVNGGSGYFDGGNDYLEISSAAALDLGTGNFTIEGWINPDNLDVVFCSGGSGTGERFDFCYVNSTGIRFFVNSSSGSVDIDFPDVVLGQWTHVAIVRDGNDVEVFYNGVSQGSTTTGGFSMTGIATRFLVGARGWQGVTQETTQGYISNFRITDAALYTSDFTPITTPLTTSVSSGTVQLLLNFTYAGIFDNTGKNVIETIGDAQIDTTIKKFGTGSMEFDNSGDWLTFVDNTEQRLGTGPFTIEAWVYPTWSSPGNNEPIIVKGNSGGTGTWQLDIQSTSKVRFAWNTSSSITSTGTVSTFQWTHIAVVREGTGTNETKIYINGANDGTGTVSQDFDLNHLLKIGRNRDDTTAFQGYIDDVRVTKGVARYTTGFTPPTAAFPNL